MPALLFHQNMRAFGGGSEPRNRAYLGRPPPRRRLPATWPHVCPAHGAVGFPAIARDLAAYTQLGPQGICAIGLTELTNAASARQTAAGLCNALLQGAPVNVHMFHCGTTAGGGGRREYAAIAIPTGVTVIALGRIATGGRVEDRISQVALQPGVVEGWTELPPGASADWRFIVYAVIERPGMGRFAAGFLHNTYTLDSKPSTAQRLRWLANEIWRSTRPPPQHIYIGGDFNVEPHAPGTRLPLTPYFVATEANTPLRFQLAGGELGGTTWHGRLYDYWLSDVAMEDRAAPLPLLHTATWDGPSGLMSDHVATLLYIP